MYLEDTITAIATAPGEGGVAIVRVSGPDTFHIADQVVRCSGDAPSARDGQTFLYGHVVGPQRDIDEVLVLIMRAPHSYTCEDMVEIQGHGGRVLAERILRRVVDCGARLAEPGEFTKRAFLNGRIDLLQAEAVLDLVKARSERAARAALEQLEGSLSARFNMLYDALLSVASDLEAILDFPEEDIPMPELSAIPHRLTPIQKQIRELVGLWDEGHLLREGALVVISGLPNVGKSTLLNRMLDTDRAIVSHMPGTTRDTIEEGLVLGGIPLRLVDTAGLRDVDCEIEREGIARTRRQMERADLHLYMVDASQPLSDHDRAQLEKLSVDRTIVILNKTDLGEIVDEKDLMRFLVLKTCLAGDSNMEAVRAAIQEKLGTRLDLSEPAHAVISERHRQLLLATDREISSGVQLLVSGADDMIVPATSHLRSAAESIGRATGRTYEDDMLNNIFSRFCIGK